MSIIRLISIQIIILEFQVRVTAYHSLVIIEPRSLGYMQLQNDNILNYFYANAFFLLIIIKKNSYANT